jgi:hypothetical protein
MARGDALSRGIKRLASFVGQGGRTLGWLVLKALATPFLAVRGLWLLLSSSRDPPFGAVLILGIAGWAMTQVVDRLGSQPLLEYSIRTDANTVRCVLRNLSREKRLSKLMLLLRFKGSAITTLSSPDITWIGGEHPGPGGDPPSLLDNSKAQYALPALNPGGEAELSAVVNGEAHADEFDIALASDTETRLLRANLATWTVRWEVPILLAIAALALFFLVLLLAGVARRSSGDEGARS